MRKLHHFPYDGRRHLANTLHDHLIRAARGLLLVIMDAGKHTFPSRTRPLSPQSPMVVQPRCCARVGRRQVIDPGLREEAGVSYFWESRRAAQLHGFTAAQMEAIIGYGMAGPFSMAVLLVNVLPFALLGGGLAWLIRRWRPARA